MSNKTSLDVMDSLLLLVNKDNEPEKKVNKVIIKKKDT